MYNGIGFPLQAKAWNAAVITLVWYELQNMLLVEAFAVIILNDAVERCLPNGVEGFREFAPGGIAYSDKFLSLCGFMHPNDAEEFLADIQIRGVRTDGEDQEAYLIHAKDIKTGESPDAPWLQAFELNGHILVKHVQDDSRTLMAPAGFDLEKESKIQHFTAEEVKERMEYVRTEDNVEVYRDKLTGQNYYIGRTTDSPEDIFNNASEILSKHFRNPGQPPTAKENHAEVRSAIGDLQKLVAKHPESWRSLFFIGKGWQSLGDSQKAYNSFSRCFQIEKSNLSVCQELAGACAELGKIEEGLSVGEHAVTLEPDNPELLSNLAVNYLLAKRGDAATKAIQRALALEPNDQVSKTVKRLVHEVIQGIRPWPNRLSDLTSSKPLPTTTKTPWWKRILGLK